MMVKALSAMRASILGTGWSPVCSNYLTTSGCAQEGSWKMAQVFGLLYPCGESRGGSSFWDGLVLAVKAIWGLNQIMEELTVFQIK